MANIAQSTATVNPAGSPVVVKVFDSLNNFGVYTLTYHVVATGAQLATLATDVNSQTSPHAQYPLPRPAATTPGTAVLCFVTLVPVGGGTPLEFTLAAFQDGARIDDGNGKLSIASAQPSNGAIRLVFQ